MKLRPCLSISPDSVKQCKKKHGWIRSLVFMILALGFQGVDVYASTVPPDPVTINYRDRYMTYSNISLNGAGNVTVVSPGESISLSFDWQLKVKQGEVFCPNCVIQWYYGIKNVFSNCIVSTTAGPGYQTNGKVSSTFKAPTIPGRYFITQSHSLLTTCTPNPAKQSDDPNHAIAQILVIPSGRMAIAYEANDGTSDLYVTYGWSPDGSDWTTQKLPYKAKESPAMALFNGQLFVAFHADDASNGLFLTSSSDGVNWSAQNNTLFTLQGSPAMCSFKGKLYIAFRANDPSNALYITSSAAPNGSAWKIQKLPMALGTSPAMASFNNKLYIAFKSNDESNMMKLTSSSDGINWSDPIWVSDNLLPTSPAMASFGNKLYIACKSDNTLNVLFTTSSSDGVNWSKALGHPTITLQGSPTMTVYNAKLFIAFKESGASNKLSIVSTSDGITWTEKTDPTVSALSNSPAASLLPPEPLRNSLPFIIAFSKGYNTDSITKWSVERADAEAEYTRIVNAAFNAILIGYAPLSQYAPNHAVLPNARFKYDPVDVADSKGLYTVIDVQSDIKVKDVISYNSNAQKVMQALRDKTVGSRENITGIHLYGEVDTAPRATAVNGVATHITDFQTMAVAQERNIRLLSSMKDITIPSGNYDDATDLRKGFRKGSTISYENLSQYTNGFFYLSPWIRNTYQANLPWRSLYAAVAMGARGIVWTPTREVGYIFDHTTGKIEPGVQYVQDINESLKGAGLGNIVSASFRAGNLSLSAKGDPITDQQLASELKLDKIASNPENDVYHSGVFSRYDVTYQYNNYWTTGTYYLLVLNWQNQTQTVTAKINTGEIPHPESFTYLSTVQPPVSVSGSQTVLSVNYKTVTLTLPAHGIALIQFTGKTHMTKNPII